MTDTAAVNRLLNQEIKCAQAAGLKVLYCIGEKSEEQEQWQQVLGDQLSIGLDGVDKSKVVIAYEPIWSIGPGKTPADKPYIEKIARFVKEQHRRPGRGVRRRPEGGQRRHAGLHPRDRRRSHRPHPLQRGDRLLPRGVPGDHSPLHGPLTDGGKPMKLDFEYGQGLMSAQLPDSTDIFIPGETVADPPCLPQDWDSLYNATLESIRHPIGMPTLRELAHKGKHRGHRHP